MPSILTVAVPERRDTSTHRPRRLPFHEITSPPRWFSPNPSVNRPRRVTIDAGTSYVTTAQPGATHLTCLEEMRWPFTTRAGKRLETSAWECQAGLPRRALTQS